MRNKYMFVLQKGEVTQTFTVEFYKFLIFQELCR